MSAMNSCEKSKAIDAAFAMADAAEPARGRTREVIVGRAEDIPVGGRKIVGVGHLTIGIFRLQDGYHAVRNYCPHQGAELCKGTLHGTYRPGAVGDFIPALPGRVLRCPWHGWEFDIVTGKGLYDNKGRISTYPTRVTPQGDLIVLV